MFKKHRPEIDLMLMDLHMPLLNGYQAARIIRELDSSIPIIAMTAYAITGVEEHCRQAGIGYNISKPFDLEQFASVIRKVLQEASPEMPS